MSKDISFHTQSIRNQNPPEGKKLTSETLSLQFPVPDWTKNPKNWTQKKTLLQDIKICDFQNIEITQSIAVCKNFGSVARASERSFRESEREGNPGRDDRKHFLVTGRRRQFRRPFCVELSSSTRPWLFLIPLKYHPPVFLFFSFISVFFL